VNDENGPKSRVFCSDGNSFALHSYRVHIALTIENDPSIFLPDYGTTTSAAPHRIIVTALPITLRAIVNGDYAAAAVGEEEVYTPTDAGRNRATRLYGIFDTRLRHPVFRAEARSASYGVQPHTSL